MKFFVLDLLIGVHCTHGVNRTGYLVCRYMIDKLDFQPKNAIEGQLQLLYPVMAYSDRTYVASGVGLIQNQNIGAGLGPK